MKANIGARHFDSTFVPQCNGVGTMRKDFPKFEFIRGASHTVTHDFEIHDGNRNFFMFISGCHWLRKIKLLLLWL